MSDNAHLSKDTFLVLSTGQSLSVGASIRGALTTREFNSDKAFQLRGNEIVPLRENNRETHASGMVAQFLHQFDKNQIRAPDVVHLHGGKSGESLSVLSVRKDDIFDSVENGILASEIGATFAVNDQGGTSFDYYVKKNESSAVHFKSSGVGSDYFDKLINDIERIAFEDAQGYRSFGDTVGIAIIHGQADNHSYYKAMLDTYKARLDQEIDAAFQRDMDVVIIMSQTRGFSGGRPAASAQLNFIKDHENVFIGAQESFYQNKYPERPGILSAHLDPVGYHIMGQEIGAKLYAGYIGQPLQPLLAESATFISDYLVNIKFSGVKGELLSDVQSYGESFSKDYDPNTLGFVANPWQFGAPKIISATISGLDSVTLKFSDKVSPDLWIFLGYSGNIPTSLRDSYTFPVVDLGVGATHHQNELYNFAPIQAFKIGSILKEKISDSTDEPSSDGMSEDVLAESDPDATHDVTPEILLSDAIETYQAASRRVIEASAPNQEIKAPGGGAVLIGADGFTRLREGWGDDVMYGSGGPDQFVWDLRSRTGTEHDKILDLNFAEGDVLRILGRTEQTWITSDGALANALTSGKLTGAVTDDGGIDLWLPTSPDRVLELVFHDHLDIAPTKPVVPDIPDTPHVPDSPDTPVVPDKTVTPEILLSDAIETYQAAGRRVIEASAPNQEIKAPGGGAVLIGADGFTRLREGWGDDVMYGSGGPDQFVWDLRSRTGTEHDKILDLNFAEGDVLRILGRTEQTWITSDGALANALTSGKLTGAVTDAGGIDLWLPVTPDRVLELALYDNFDVT